VKPKLPVGPLAVYNLAREARIAAQDERSLAVGGAPQLAAALRRELAQGAEPGAIVEAEQLDDAAALVYVLAGRPTPDDERALKAAHRKRVPIVVVLADPSVRGQIPYVLATDVVPVPAGSGFPLEEIARALAGRLEERGTPLAARLPFLRRAVADVLVRRFSRTNGLVGVAVFVPGADLPVLTLNQLRLVLRLASAYGHAIERERLPEILGVIASGFGFRALAREALGFLPLAGWIVKGGIAYAGTRAIGEAATTYFEARASTPPPDGASPDGP
jgi:uncharacterized protein (DUF697 family)